MSVSKLIKPEEGATFKPWLKVGFVAGRAKSSEMLANTREVFESAFRMVDEVAIIAKDSHDTETSRKIEVLRARWRELALNGATKDAMEDLGILKKKLALETDVSKASGMLQKMMDPYAREIWGEAEGVEKLEVLGHESSQYANKSEALLSAPLWRRGLERIWQAFGRIHVVKDTSMQLEEMRNIVSLIYKQEIGDGEGEIGKWFREYSRKSFVAVVLARGRETGSLGGIDRTIDFAIENPEHYMGVVGRWMIPKESGKMEPAVVEIKSVKNAVRHFGESAQELSNKLEYAEKFGRKGDPIITEINYGSIGLARSLNSMLNRITEEEEISQVESINRKLKKEFESAGKKLGLDVHAVDVGKQDLLEKEEKSVLNSAKEYFRDILSRNIPIFENEEELENFFKKREKEIVEQHKIKVAIFEELVRDKPVEKPTPEINAQLLW